MFFQVWLCLSPPSLVSLSFPASFISLSPLAALTTSRPPSLSSQIDDSQCAVFSGLKSKSCCLTIRTARKRHCLVSLFIVCLGCLIIPLKDTSDESLGHWTSYVDNKQLSLNLLWFQLHRSRHPQIYGRSLIAPFSPNSRRSRYYCGTEGRRHPDHSLFRTERWQAAGAGRCCSRTRRTCSPRGLTIAIRAGRAVTVI